MGTEAQEEKEPAYGEWHSFTPQQMAAEDKLHPADPGEVIEPSWEESVPRRMRRLCGSPEFSKDGVDHRYRPYYRTVELDWTFGHSLAVLRDKPIYLPSSKYSSQWSGVYRVYAQNTTINRLCGNDATGTLYIGCGGTGRRNWSILRSRIKAIIDRDHHGLSNWNVIDKVQQKFPWDLLAVQWAYTGRSRDHKGDDVAEAEFAEAFLLGSYNEAFGELPPWNLRS